MMRASHVALGGMGLLETALPLLMFLLLPPPTTPTTYSLKCPCASREPRNGAVVLLEEQVIGTTTWMSELNCCPHQLLAAHDPQYSHNDSFSIVWSFKGVEYKMVDGVEQKWPRKVSTFRTAFCGLQTLESDGLRFSDDGVYSCLVTSSSGASVNKTFSLCINEVQGSLPPKSSSSISEDTQAILRQAVTFKCSVNVGRPRCERTEEYRLVWTKERPDGSWVEASKLPHAEITTSGVEEEVMKSRFMIRSIQTEHFGRYRCTVTNYYGNLSLNVSLRKGVPAIIRVTGEYRAALVIMVAATMFLGVTVLFWRRCQVAFSLHFRQKKADSSTDGHQHDVFLVHGDSASTWVWSFLLPILEDSFGYTCFLPQRDMCGGSMIIEEVAASVWDCRCVVVVVTPCLLENPWAAWALHNAVKAALQARIRLLALLLQDLEPRKGLPDTSGIVDILKHIRKIRVPRSCRCEDSKPKEDPFPNNPPKEETQVHDDNNSLKPLRIDSTTICRSRSKSPKNQKLSNMITGGNMASKDATEDKKKPKCRGPIIFVERDDSEEPASPCSTTPFILPSAAGMQKDRPTLALTMKKPSLTTFLSVLCTGDQQEMFWHTLLGWLGPPDTTKPQKDATSTTCSV